MRDTTKQASQTNTLKKALLALCCISQCIGGLGGPLLLRLYFLKGGQRVWLTSLLQTAGWPLSLIPLSIAYFNKRRSTTNTVKLFNIQPPVFLASAFIGLLTGLDNYLYSYGLARLPVSTSALVTATQLAFTAFFAFLLVKQKFTAYSVNAIVLLTTGAGVLALNASGDRPGNESNRQYIIGFLMTLGAAALYGFTFPLLELTYKKAKQDINYTLVMEIQVVMCLFATIFSTVGMIVANDFKAIPKEAREFELGEARYYVVVVWSAILFEGYFIGAVGVVFCASALLSGILASVLVPIAEVLGVLFFHEKFKSEKGVSLALSLWGFVSYFYGEAKQSKINNDDDNNDVPAEIETPQTHSDPNANV